MLGRSDVELAVDPVDPSSGSARQRKLDMLTDLVGAGFEDVVLVILDRDDPVLHFEAIRANSIVYTAPVATRRKPSGRRCATTMTRPGSGRWLARRTTSGS